MLCKPIFRKLPTPSPDPNARNSEVCCSRVATRSVVTVKADVYNIGIVILEIVCRRRNVDCSRSESSFHLLEILQKKAQEDQLIDNVEDIDEDM